jgi:hypothetical protein
MAPDWFELVAWAALAAGFASAHVIGADIALLRNRQHMAIMNLVFPLTGLYMGPVAVWAYVTRGRRMSHKQMRMDEAAMTNDLEARDSWWQVSLSDSHCGAGCVLGDVCGEWVVWATGWMIGSTAARPPIRPRSAARLDLRDLVPASSAGWHSPTTCSRIGRSTARPPVHDADLDDARLPDQLAGQSAVPDPRDKGADAGRWQDAGTHPAGRRIAGTRRSAAWAAHVTESHRPGRYDAASGSEAAFRGCVGA